MTELVNNNHKVEAKLYGENIAQLPLDLFIPPDALEVYLESFEGPLDLLLYLNSFGIYEISLDIFETKFYFLINSIYQH